MRAAVCLCALAMVGPLATTGAAQSDAAHQAAEAAGAKTPPPQTVRIDVIAADARGRTLDNLKPTDFELKDDGTAQALDGATLVRATDESPRVVAVFLDEYHVGADQTDRVRAAMTHFVDQQLRPQDLLVVMRPLDSLFAIRLTTDRAAAHEAIDAFSGRRGDYTARNSCEQNFMAGVPGRIEAARTQVVVSALNALAVQLAQVVDRRKTLLVVSEGFGRSERRRGLEYLPTVETVIRSAVQGNASIYPLMPSGDADGDERSHETLKRLAAETAGQAFTGDLANGLTKAIADASAYYLLTFRTSRPNDGKFHAVQVRVKRPGVTLLARSGYFAPSPDEAFRAAVLARLNEPKPPVKLEPAPHASPFIRPWFGMSRGGDGKTRVKFVWEPVTKLTGERGQRIASRLVVTALAPDDSVLFEGVVLPTGPAAQDEPGGPASRAVFEMAPGRLRLRMSVLDGASQEIDSDIRSLVVRDMKNGVALGTPEVLRARNAREFRTLDEATAVPVAAREFSRTERLLIRFNAYGSSDAPPVVSARLLSKFGGALRTLSIAPAKDDAGSFEIELPLAALANGEYAVEVSAATPAGDAKDVIDFRVTT